MKDLNEILKDNRILEVQRNTQNDKSKQVKVTIRAKYNNKIAFVKFTQILGWEHLSVSFEDETPSWDFMQELKEMFWNDDEVCFQLHPKKSEYINNHEHCLHIWRNIEDEIKTPPTIFVGFRKGNEEEDRELLKKMQEDMGNPLTDCEIDLLMLSNIKDSNTMSREFDKLIQKYSRPEVFKASIKMMIT